MADASPKPHRTPLSRDRVLGAAMTLADEHGIEAVTMRRLGQQLGVEAMALYYHAANKDDILAGITDLVVQQIELPAPGGDWKASIRASAISAHEVLRLHPWACNLLMSGPRVLPARLRHIDALLGRLADAGLPDDVTDLAYHALDSHILGFTLWEAGYTTALRRLPAGFLATMVQELALESYPHLVEHVAYHLRPPVENARTAFEFGLDVLLDGIDASRTR